MIDLSKLQPTRISRDLKGKYMLIYGTPKSGKTSLATKFPKSLLLAFEKGYNALPGIMAQDIVKWTDMREVLRELRKPAIQATFDTVIVDTASIAWDKCSDYICTQNGVKALTDIPWGKGAKLCAKEYENTFREITLLGYGLVFTAHAEEKTPFGGDDSQTYIAPMLDKRPYAIINGMVDIIACIDTTADGERFLQFRATPRMFAGCRFEYMPDRLPLDYGNFVEALASAIEQQGEESGGLIVDEATLKEDEASKRPFSEAMNEAKELWTKLLAKDESDEMFEKMQQIVENEFGSRIKLSAATPAQQDMLELVILGFKDLLDSDLPF